MTGGLFIGLGLAAFILAAPAVYQALGIMYLAIAIVRAISMFLDQSVVQSNIISLVVEIGFGIIPVRSFALEGVIQSDYQNRNRQHV